MWLNHTPIVAAASMPPPATSPSFGFRLRAIIKPIAMSRPRHVQISPPREPVKSKEKKQVSAAAERTTSRKAKCSLVGVRSSRRSEDHWSDWNERYAQQNHRIVPAPRKVAAVLWLTKVAVRLPWYASFGAHNSMFGVSASATNP